MRGEIRALSNQLTRIQGKLMPPPKRELRRPTPWVIVMAHDDDRDFPGCEAHNREQERLARVWHMPLRSVTGAYLGLQDEQGAQAYLHEWRSYAQAGTRP